MQAIDIELKDDSHYLFATAELASREKDFLDDNKLKRLIASPNVVEMSKILRETYYSRYADYLEAGTGFDQVVQQEFKAMAAYLVRNLKPQHQPALDLLFAPEMVHNYKTIFKALSSQENLEPLFLVLGRTYTQLIGAAKSGEEEGLNPLEQAMLEKIRELEKQKTLPRPAEVELEKYFLSQLSSIVPQTGSPLLSCYFKHHIDMYNIKNTYRHWLTQDTVELEHILVEGGFLKTEFYQQIKKDGAEGFFKQLEKTMYRPLVTKGGQLLTEHHDYSAAEKNEDLFYILFLSPAKYAISNLEKVFTFFLKKKIEIKTLNLIYSGVLFDMDKDQIRHEVLILDEDQNRSNW